MVVVVVEVVDVDDETGGCTTVRTVVVVTEPGFCDDVRTGAAVDDGESGTGVPGSVVVVAAGTVVVVDVVDGAMVVVTGATGVPVDEADAVPPPTDDTARIRTA